ncbi:hypothetical protein [Bdellovibrio sp.]|uniref:hypothetical protein n=1 Tax=Bdellovibrio sp. TaxID=28201 RepID=UPI0032213F2D
MRLENLGTIIAAIPLLLYLSGCASPGLHVQSEPGGADVYFKSSEGTLTKIGTTPLNVDANKLPPSRNAFQITLSKDGYLSENFVIPAAKLPQDTQISVSLRENSKKTEDRLDHVASNVASIQQQIRNRDLDRAEQTLQLMVVQYPDVATFHELLGNVFYLKKDLTQALDSYKRAANLNPKNIETRNMIQRLSQYQSGGDL